MSAPHRPRLAEHAWIRRHRLHDEAGDARDVAMVHDLRDGSVLQLDPRVADLLSFADGTRDLDGIALAASQASTYGGIAELRTLIEGLHARGLVAEGTESPTIEPIVPPTPADRPIDRLAFTLVCDASGVCCTQYGSYAFTEIEAMRAWTLVPDVLSGTPMRRVFLPLAGSVRRGTFAVAVEDGRCVYLRDSGGCAIHAAGGAEAKPLSCRLYPVTLFDDGVSLRASVRPECACVLASADRSDGAPLLDPAAKTAGDLRGGAIVRVLPEQVPLTRTRTIDRRTWARLSSELASTTARDVASTYWSLARALEDDVDDLDAARAAFEARPSSDEIRAAVAALAPRLEPWTRPAGDWRSPRDRVHVGRRAVAEATRSIVNDAALPSPNAARDEAFHLRASLFGHFVAESAPIVDALRDRAVRIVIARAIDVEPHPLALVETMFRAHAVGA